MSVRWDVARGDVDAQFADDVDALLGPSPYAWAVVSGLRSSAAQAVLFAKYQAGGPLAAAPGHSAHEHGLAVDVAYVSPMSGLETYNYAHDAAWPWLWQAVKASAALHSGHDFPPVAPADDDHVEAVRWFALRAELQASGQWSAEAAAA